MLLALILFLLLITPVRLTILHQGQTTLRLQLWGIGGSFQPDLTPDTPAQSWRVLRMIGTFLRAGRARRFLLQHVRLICLRAMVRIRLNDASRTCLLAGFLRQLLPLLPAGSDVRIYPEFLLPSRVHVRCIVFFHLGTIIITAAMVLLAYYRESREHPKPQPKEA